MEVIISQVDDELQNLINSTPAIQRIKAGNYTFFKFYKDKQFRGFVGYWLLNGAGWEGSYAFIIVRSLKRGWGTKMMKYALPRIPADLAIWIAELYNVPSINLAVRLGFNREDYIEFQQKEEQMFIKSTAWIGALQLKGKE